MVFKLAVNRTSTARRPPVRHPKAFLLGTSGKKWVLPYAPLPVSIGGLAGAWAQNDRPGRKPLLQRSGPGLQTLTFTLTLAYPDGRPIGTTIYALKLLAANGEAVTFSYGSTERGVYQITGCDVNVTMRQEGSNEPVRADAQIVLTETSTAKLSLGPLTGGKGAPTAITVSTGVPPGARPPAQAAPPKGSAGTKTAAPTGRRVALNANESIASFSNRTTGSTGNWRAILDASGITRPDQLHAGTMLLVPAGLPHVSGSADMQQAQMQAGRTSAQEWYDSFAPSAAGSGSAPRPFGL